MPEPQLRNHNDLKHAERQRNRNQIPSKSQLKMSVEIITEIAVLRIAETSKSLAFRFEISVLGI